MQSVSRIRQAALAAILIVLALATGAQAEVDKHFLWQVSSGRNTVYILGSLHLAKPDFYPLAPVIEKAFADSQALVVEADVTKMDQGKMQQWLMTNAVYPPGDNLEKHISNRTKAKMTEMKADMRLIGQMKPWLAAVSLQAQKLAEMGFDENQGVDRHFLVLAQNHKKIIELEGVDYQLRLFKNLTPEDQELFLYSTLVDLSEMEGVLTQTIEAWRRGDSKAFEELFFKGSAEHPELKPLLDKIIFKRNLRMTTIIEGLLRSKQTYFVIVGAGHLVGEQGVIEHLRAKGLQVNQM